jgi:gliding motility-associated-like protein
VSAPTCKDVPINLTDLSTFDSRSTLNYAWNFGNTTTSTNKSPTVTYTTTGAFNVQQSVGYLGVSGCSNTLAKPITVSIPTVPTITASANPICQGETSTLSIAGSYTSIAWVGVSGSTSSVPITAPAKYTVNTTDVNGCASSAFINITAKPAYTPFVVVTDKPTIKVGEQAQLSATLGGDSYLWTPAEGLNNVNIANPIASPLVNTTYKVVAKKSGLCDAQGTIEIKVDTTSPDAPILPPALFSPNGDGINDKWIIPNVSNNSDCVMTIYDGQGSQIFQKKGYDSGPWDGTYNGSVVPAGVYYFVFNCPSANPTTGSVLVVK